jgi:DNA/RNA endonuclease YhcR with UshA esterase domain
MGILSLSVAYFTYYPGSPGNAPQPFTDATEPGERVAFEGVVYEKTLTSTGDHLILTIDYDGRLVTVFVPGSAGAPEINGRVAEGDRLGITGTVDEYKGEKEVVVEEGNDVVLLP